MKSSILAAYLASRICHDVATPLQTLMNGADVAFDENMGASLRAEGVKLVNDGIAKMNAKVQFMRMAVGSQLLMDGPANTADAQQRLAVLAETGKQQLEWSVPVDLSNHQVRILLNMSLIGLESLGKNGVLAVAARADGDRIAMSVRATGGKTPLKPEILNGLEAREPERGWTGAAAQAYYLRLIADEAGYTLQAGRQDDVTHLSASGPRSSF
jgi:histidine phosphotransferase ChpT